MDLRLILKAIGFLSLPVVGVPGNLIIIASFSHFRIYDGKLMPADIILLKLSFNNLVVVLIRGIPQTLHSLGIRNLFNQPGCNFFILAYRASRAMSIFLTSLLSCYQWALLAPTSLFWAMIKQRLAQRLLAFILSLWVINTTFCALTITSYSWVVLKNSTVHALNLEFCFYLFASPEAFVIIGTIYSLRDFFFITLMILSSLCIVVVLYRHGQQVKSIRSSRQKIKNSAESRAAKSVLMLVSTYVFFFGLDNCMWLYTICVDASADPVLSDARIFFGCCYSAVSPIVIIATNKKVQLKLRTLGARELPEGPETSISYITA